MFTVVQDVAPQTWIHLASVAPAMALGIVQLAGAKGTPAHRALGRLWATLMLVASISSFWIQRHGFSWIHALSVVTITSVVMGGVYARQGQSRAHARCMIGALLGSVGAGIGAVAPGRLLHTMFFGP